MLRLPGVILRYLLSQVMINEAARHHVEYSVFSVLPIVRKMQTNYNGGSQTVSTSSSNSHFRSGCNYQIFQFATQFRIGDMFYYLLPLEHEIPRLYLVDPHQTRSLRCDRSET